MSPPVPLMPQAWAQIRDHYENTKRPIEEICREHGISAGTLRDRVRRWGWKPRWGAIPVQGPPAVVIPQLEYRPTLKTGVNALPVESALSPSPIHAANSGEGSGVGAETGRTTPTTPLRHFVGGGKEEPEPSPHIIEDGRERPFVDNVMSLGERLQGAVVQVMPALETTLASLAAGPMQPREMEQAARALGSLTRTLRELTGLLAQHRAAQPHQSVDELRASVARKLDIVMAQQREAQPLRYLAGWTEFADEVQAAGTADRGSPERG
jgi:hypothetical protein